MSGIYYDKNNDERENKLDEVDDWRNDGKSVRSM